jgi:hypothetical protein
MQMMRKILLLAAWLVAASANAGFVDNRSAPGTSEVDAMYKNVQVDDLVAGLVPSAYAIEYASPAARAAKVSVVGKGPWNALLDQALAGAGLRSTVDTNLRTVKIAPVAAPAAPTVLATAQSTSMASTAAEGATRVGAAAQTVGKSPLPTTPEATPKAAPAGDLYRVNSSDGSVSRVVLRWAAQADMQLVWEPIDVDYPVQAENVWGNDIRVALGGLFSSLTNAQTALRACIHPNKPRPVIRVIRAGESCRDTGATL